MIKIKIVLDKVKVRLSRNEINDLMFLVERAVTLEMNSNFEAAYIHAAWLNLLKEVAVKLMDKDLEDKEKKDFKVSASQAQYMALLELFQYGYPEGYDSVFANSAYGKLVKVGVDNNLIEMKRGVYPTPLLKANTNNNQNLLGYGDVK